MKLIKQEILIETNSTDETIDFTINSADSVVFDILRKNMYTDPIGAVVREICTNARDANAEVGKANVPISITLPNNSYPYLVIKDCGPGISPERMANFYSSYGSSTKRNTNDQIGAFGLGSKTPFCLTDQYIITSNIDGLKYEYTCYIDESGRGKISKSQPEATKEQNGTSIKIPIKKEHFQQCKEKAFYYTQYWPVQPIFPGQFDSRKPPVVLMEGKGWKLFESRNSYETRPRLILAGIPYNVNDTWWCPDKITYSYSSEHRIPTGFCFDVKTGEVAISANRESIFEDDATKNVLLNIWKDFKIAYLKEYKDNLDKKDLFEGMDYIEGLIKSHGSYFHNIAGTDIEIKGISISDLQKYIKIDYAGQKYYYSEGRQSYTFDMFPRTKQIVLLEAKELNSNIKSKCSRYFRENNITKCIMFLTGDGDQYKVGNAIREYWKNKPDAKIIDLDAVKTSKPRAQKQYVYYYNGREQHAKKLTLDDLKTTDKFVYVEWLTNRPELDNIEFTKLGYQLAIMKPAYVKKIKNHAQFITLQEFMKIWHDKEFSKEKSLELLKFHNSGYQLDNRSKKLLNVILPNSFREIDEAEKLAKKEDSKLKLLNYVASHHNHDYGSEYYKAFGQGDSLIAKLQQLTYEEIQKYPLLIHMQYYTDIVPYKAYVDAMKKTNRSTLLSDFIKTV